MSEALSKLEERQGQHELEAFLDAYLESDKTALQNLILCSKLHQPVRQAIFGILTGELKRERGRPWSRKVNIRNKQIADAVWKIFGQFRSTQKAAYITVAKSYGLKPDTVRKIFAEFYFYDRVNGKWYLY